jgi:hypothetical protein
MFASGRWQARIGVVEACCPRHEGVSYAGPKHALDSQYPDGAHSLHLRNRIQREPQWARQDSRWPQYPRSRDMLRHDGGGGAMLAAPPRAS